MTLFSRNVPPVIAAAHAFRAVGGDTATTRIVDEFRRATLRIAYYDSHGVVIPLAASPGTGVWLCAYSSMRAMKRSIGGRVQRSYAITGADILDRLAPVLVQFTRLTGILLDIGSDHEVAVPLIEPIVTPAVAAQAYTDFPGSPRTVYTTDRSPYDGSDTGGGAA